MTNSNESLREEFNRWAEDGRGEGMEEDHLPIALPVLAEMDLRADDDVLDVGCGAGWLVERMAQRVTEGRVIGMDVSDEMVRRARKRCAAFENVMCVTGGVDEIPWDGGIFTKVISVESAYYWPDPARGLREVFRVMREGGGAWVVINYYKDNAHCHQWAQHYAIPTHLLSAEEWAGLFREAGFAGVGHGRVVDRSATPEVYTGRWFRDAEQLRAFKAEGALVVRGRK